MDLKVRSFGGRKFSGFHDKSRTILNSATISHNAIETSSLKSISLLLSNIRAMTLTKYKMYILLYWELTASARNFSLKTMGMGKKNNLRIQKVYLQIIYSLSDLITANSAIQLWLKTLKTNKKYVYLCF